MDEKVIKYLEDIRKSIESIREYLGGRQNFKEFQGNKLLKRGIEREFEIIGEAMGKILKLQPGITIKHSKRIVSLRNHIVHAYDNVYDDILWGIIVNHLPLLEKEVAELLKINTGK